MFVKKGINIEFVFVLDEINVMSDIYDDDSFKKTTRQVGRQGAVRGKKIYEERSGLIIKVFRFLIFYIQSVFKC